MKSLSPDKTTAWHLTLLFALVIGDFWHLWNIVFGEIPALTELLWRKGGELHDGTVKPDIIWTLPFSVSRSWDIVGVSLFSLILFWLLRWSREKKGAENIIEGLAFGMVFGLLGLVFGWTVGMIGWLTIGLFVWLFVIVIGLFVKEPANGIGLGLTYSFAFGLFWLGLLPGFVLFLVISSPLLVILAVRNAFFSVPNQKNAPCVAD